MSNKKIITKIIPLLFVALAIFVFYAVTTKDGKPGNNTSASKTCTTYGNKTKEQCIEDYIGLSQEEAIDRAREYRYTPKIVSVEGAEQAITDEGSTPIYLEIENNYVTGGYFEEGRKIN